MKLLYFAWIREKIGREQEEIDLPHDVATVGELILWQKQRGPEFEDAFAQSDLVRVAINQTHVQHSENLKDAREIAFFPPVTGG